MVNNEIVVRSIDDGKAYLRIVPFRPGVVRVERTTAGKKRLNGFWAFWLRQLILNTDVRHGFAVEVRRSSVLVQSETTQQGLIETVRSLAAQIVPVQPPPMERTKWIKATNLHWNFEASFEPENYMPQVLLPPGGYLSHRYGWYEVRRRKDCQFSIGELASMVEMQVALTLHRERAPSA